MILLFPPLKLVNIKHFISERSFLQPFRTAQGDITDITHSYLMEQMVQGAIAHVLCDDAEELGLVADAKDLDDVVEPCFVKHFRLLQQAVSLSGTQ